MKKLLALFLCLLMVASVVIGCSGEKTPGGESKDSGSKDSGTSGTELKDDLPADLDFNNMTIKTAYREDQLR